MTMGRKQRVSESSESVAVERDHTRVPGKPFLEHLHRVLNGGSSADEGLETSAATAGIIGRARGASVRQLLVDRHDASSSRELSINAPCLCYLEKLLYAMLTPTKSEHTGRITQWRLNAAFARQLEEDPDCTTGLGSASPERILQLAGRLLEIDVLRLEVLPAEVNLPMPSDCDLFVFPKLSRLHLHGIDLSLVRGITSLAHTLVELSYTDGTAHSLASLLAPDVESPAPTWRNLRSLAVRNVQLAKVQVNEAALAPNLETVVIQNAGLASYDALTRCAWLSVLDLSNNHIYSLDIPMGAFEQLRVLNLSHNHVSSIQSLQGCANLEAIDLGYNLIMSLGNVRELTRLQQLRSIVLMGNPIARHALYRQDIRHMLSDEVVLDDIPWEVQDFDDFTGKIDSGRHNGDTVEDTQVSFSINKSMSSSGTRFNIWSAARGILRSCFAIGFAQILVSTLWSRDVEAERITMWIVMATAGLGIISATLAIIVSWGFKTLQQKLSPQRGKTQQTDAVSDPTELPISRMRKIARGFSMKLNDHDKTLLSADAELPLHLDTLSDSLHAAVRAGDDLSLLLLEDVCSQVKTLLAYLSGPGGDGIGFAWMRMSRAMPSFGQGGTSTCEGEQMVRERLSSCISLALDAAEPSTSFSTSMTKILPVFRLTAIVLSSIASESDLQEVLRDAYVQVFASRHPWWRQRSILTAISTAPETDAFLEWLSSRRASNHRHLIKALHKCGERLHLLHAALQDLVDEHEHSFRHHTHPTS